MLILNNVHKYTNVYILKNKISSTSALLSPVYYDVSLHRCMTFAGEYLGERDYVVLNEYKTLIIPWVFQLTSTK